MTCTKNTGAIVFRQTILRTLHQKTLPTLLLLLASSSLLLAQASSPTQTILNAMPSPLVEQESTLLTASVWSNSDTVTRGWVTFQDGAVVLGQAALQADGSATLRVVLSPGIHALRALYAGTVTNQPSASQPQAVRQLGHSTTKLTSTGSAGKYYLEEDVTSNTGLAPNGKVEFFDLTSNRSLATSSLWFARAPTIFTQTPTPPIDGFVAEDDGIAGDLNGDGIQDVVTAGGGNDPSLWPFVAVSLYDQSGTPTSKVWQAAPNDQLITKLALIDFNNDGKLDLVVDHLNYVGNPMVNHRSLFCGDGAGNFTLVKTEDDPIAAADGTEVFKDFNGDGIIDMLGRVEGKAPYYSAYQVFPGDGKGNFLAPTTDAAAHFSYLAPYFADLNGDGYLDIVATPDYNDDPNGYHLYVYFGDSAGGFSTTPPAQVDFTFTGYFTYTMADFNGDDKLDLALYDGGDRQSVTILLGDGTGHFSPASGAPWKLPFKGDARLYPTDLNGDGKVDLMISLYTKTPNHSGVPGPPVLLYALGDGQGNLTQQTGGITNINTLLLTMGDFNGDGKPDFRAAGYTYINSPQSLSTTKVNVLVLGTGTHQIVGRHDGGDYLPASTTDPIEVAAVQLSSSITLATSKALVASVTPVKLTANVRGTNGAPSISGIVDFYDGEVLLGSASIDVTRQTATLTITGLAPGSHQLRAEYEGNEFFRPSSSVSVGQTVTR